MNKTINIRENKNVNYGAIEESKKDLNQPNICKYGYI